MHDQPNRRQFLTHASLAAAACAAIPSIASVAAAAASAPPTTAPSAEGTAASAGRQPIVRVGGPSLKVSLNAYSFSKMLNDRVKRNAPGGISLMDLLDFCAKHDF